MLDLLEDLLLRSFTAGLSCSTIRAVMRRPTTVLGIGGLTIEPRLIRGLEAEQGEELTAERVREASTALGYAAHATQLLGAILGIPLRYPLALGSSKSAVLDQAAGVGRSSV